MHHLFNSNRLQGPILILSQHSVIEKWVDILHTYTSFKVAVLSGILDMVEWYTDVGADRRFQWAEYLGPLRSLYVGEYNVFIMSIQAFKQYNATDLNYVTTVGFSLVVLDDFM